VQTNFSVCFSKTMVPHRPASAGTKVCTNQLVNVEFKTILILVFLVQLYKQR